MWDCCRIALAGHPSVMLEIFEATVVNGLVGDEIVEYMGQGRTAVAISP